MSWEGLKSQKPGVDCACDHDHRPQAEQGHGHLLSCGSCVCALTMFTGCPSKVKGTQSHLNTQRSQ